MTQVFACSNLRIFVFLWIFSHQCNIGTATVTLTSTLDERQTTCPGEIVTYTCTALRTSSITWFVLQDIDVDYFPNSPLGQQTIGDFQLTLTNRVPDPINPTTIADLTITLTVTATAGRNGTVVECRGDDPSKRMSLTLNVANPGQPPSPPQDPGYHVQHYGPHNVTGTVQWGYPEFDGGVPVDNYTISGTNIMTTTSQINETTLTLPYNARQTIQVAATNCNGTSGIAMFTYFEAGCGEPTPPSNGSIDNFTSAAEGATITYSCSLGLVPGSQFSAVCTNMTWRPDPATQCREPTDCGAPPPPVSGSVHPHTNTTEGSVVVFQCDPGFVPEGEMTAVCGRDGQWTPNPGGVTCSPGPTQTFTQTATPTQTSSPTSSTPVPQMQSWVVPVVVVFVSVLVISCVVIIIIVGIIVVRRRQSEVAKKLDASSDHLELRSPTMDEIDEPSRSQGETTVIEAQYHVVQETSEKTGVVPAEYSSVVQISGQRPQVPGGLMYADLGPHIQAAVRPPSTADNVQYSSLLHGEAVQAPLDPADKSLNLDNLIIQLQHVDITKWYLLGEALGVPKRRLNDITSHHSAEPDQCKVEVLDYWLRNCTRPTWREVANALTQIHESELANSLREVYTTGILPVTVGMGSLPRSTLAESPPPPLPPKQFSDDDLLPSLECHEPPQNPPPPHPPKAQQNKPPPKPTAPPRPPKGHQRGAPPDAPPRPPKPGQS